MLDSLYRSTKTFTLLSKFKILNFETLSRVHVYRIEYVSYRQGPYCPSPNTDTVVLIAYIQTFYIEKEGVACYDKTCINDIQLYYSN